jgi:hypothetical protein
MARAFSPEHPPIPDYEPLELLGRNGAITLSEAAEAYRIGVTTATTEASFVQEHGARLLEVPGETAGAALLYDTWPRRSDAS